MRVTIRWMVQLTALAAVAGCGGDGDGKPIGAPAVDAAESPTNENPITLTGTGEAGALLQVRGGADAVVEGEVGADGAFTVDVPLREDAINTLLVSQSVDGTESMAVTLEVVHDGTAPEMPTLDPVATPTRRVMVTVRGSAEAGADIRITGGAEDAAAAAGDDGSFEAVVTLQAAVASVTENTLSVTAVDAAGNESAPAVTMVVHDPTLPLETPALDDLPDFTNETTVTVSGSADAEVGITVSGGAAPASTTTDADGAFSVDVELAPNAPNTLSVFAVNPSTGMSSAPTAAVVVHDDVAPEAPTVDPIASPTGATVVRVVGSTEPEANITVTGGAAEASGTADADGAFSVDVTLTEDAVNDLVVTPIDRAGNAGEAAMLTVEQDSSLPVPVTVDPTTSPTSDNPITLTGSTEASADVQITGGSSAVSVTAAADGTFSASVPLTPNTRNELHVQRTGSSADTIVVIVHDDVAPEPPAMDTLPSPTNRTEVDVSGMSEPSARISVSGGSAPATGRAGTTGRFSVPVTIPMDTTTTLSVIATDRAGNSSSPSSVMVTHSSMVPDAPVVDDASPAPTNAATHVVTGHITEPGPGIDIRITGGAATAVGPTEEATGTFSVEVPLTANASNELQVVSVEGAIESPAAIVTITHDDVAPAAPDETLISVGSPALSTCVARTESINLTGGAGAVEGLARVRVANIASSGASASANANMDGSFSTSVVACEGDRLSVTAEDAAGNVSTATELTVM